MRNASLTSSYFHVNLCLPHCHRQNIVFFRNKKGPPRWRPYATFWGHDLPQT
jgi:hypothetical protein